MKTLEYTHTHTYTQTLRTIEPQVPAASPTHAAKPEKQRYMASIHQKKVSSKSHSVDDEEQHSQGKQKKQKRSRERITI